MAGDMGMHIRVLEKSQGRVLPRPAGPQGTATCRVPGATRLPSGVPLGWGRGWQSSSGRRCLGADKEESAAGQRASRGQAAEAAGAPPPPQSPGEEPLLQPSADCLQYRLQGWMTPQGGSHLRGSTGLSEERLRGLGPGMAGEWLGECWPAWASGGRAASGEQSHGGLQANDHGSPWGPAGGSGWPLWE